MSTLYVCVYLGTTKKSQWIWFRKQNLNWDWGKIKKQSWKGATIFSPEGTHFTKIEAKYNNSTSYCITLLFFFIKRNRNLLHYSFYQSHCILLERSHQNGLLHVPKHTHINSTTTTKNDASSHAHHRQGRVYKWHETMFWVLGVLATVIICW